MIPILGTLERHPDGVLTGVFRTLSIRAQLELRPAPPADGVRTYEVIAAPDFRLGVGQQAADDVLSPIDLRLRAPELPREVHARAVWTDGDTWTMLWLDD